jgi:hypothetical protein
MNWSDGVSVKLSPAVVFPSFTAGIVDPAPVIVAVSPLRQEPDPDAVAPVAPLLPTPANVQSFTVKLSEALAFSAFVAVAFPVKVVLEV